MSTCGARGCSSQCVFAALKSVVTFPWTDLNTEASEGKKNKNNSSDLNWARRQIESERAHIMYPLFVHLAHCTELDGQMMRINTETTGTIAAWFVNLSNQWKSRNRKWLWSLCFAFPKGYSTLRQTARFSFQRDCSTRAAAGWFPDSRLLPHFFFFFPPAW